MTVLISLELECVSWCQFGVALLGVVPHCPSRCPQTPVAVLKHRHAVPSLRILLPKLTLIRDLEALPPRGVDLSPAGQRLPAHTVHVFLYAGAERGCLGGRVRAPGLGGQPQALLEGQGGSRAGTLLEPYQVPVGHG